MICTFGDLTDVTWWRDLWLADAVGRRQGRPARAGTVRRARVGSPSTRRGRMPPCTPRSRANRSSGPRSGSWSCSASRAISSASRDPITHAVKYYERGKQPLEIVTSWQWYVRTLDHREALLARGRELNWHPEYMRARYEAWVEGLTGRLEHLASALLRRPVPGLVSARRGAARSSGDDLLVASEDRLAGRPVDRRAGRVLSEDQRGKPGGFVGDPDVMDTWATSSLTPQIAGKWEDDPELFATVFPMDLRPQAHEIIRTWLFSTIVRSELEHRVSCRGVTPPSPAGSSTRTARRWESRSATPSRRSTTSRSTAPTPCVTGRDRPASARTRSSARSR